jgi:LysR family transcriptional regulator, transcriptional activator for dmlA
MGILDDTAIFSAIIQQGGFARAAKFLNLSNGMISRRIALLESKLGVSLIKRTTRQLILTPEGEIFWQHAQRIQQELDAAITSMQASSNKPKGTIHVSAPVYFGRHYLTPIITKFVNEFDGIKINLILSNHQVDPIKENIDLAIRGTGYLNQSPLKDSSLHMKLLFNEKIRIYASPAYLLKNGEPKDPTDLANHTIISYSNSNRLYDQEKWNYFYLNKKASIILNPKFNCNDIESSLYVCSSGYGIGRYTELNVKDLLRTKLLQPILKEYEWGDYQLFAVFSHQKALPKRSRLLLDFIYNYMKNFMNKIST